MSTSTIPIGKEEVDELVEELDLILNEVSGSSGDIERFREEYKKLYFSLQTVMNNETILEDKCKELENSIVDNSEKINSVMQITIDDQQTIYNLKNETEKAWKLVKEYNEKELQAKGTIKTLTQDLTDLSELHDRGMGFKVQQEKKIFIRVLREKDKAENENKNLKNKIGNFEKDLKQLKDREKELKKSTKELKMKKAMFLGVGKERSEREKFQKGHKEKAASTNFWKDKLLRKNESKCSDLENEYDRINASTEKMKDEIQENLMKFFEYENLIENEKKIINDTKKQISIKSEQNGDIYLKNEKQLNLVQEKQKDLVSIQNKIGKSEDFKNSEIIKLERYRKNRRDCEEDIKRYENTIVDVENEINLFRTKIEDLKKEVKRTEYEKDMCLREILERKKIGTERIKFHKQIISNMNNLKYSCDQQKGYIEKQNSRANEMKKIQRKLSYQTSILMKDYKRIVESNRMIEVGNREYEKQLKESADSVKKVQKKNENITAEKNRMLISFEESEEEIVELKRNHNMLIKQLVNLRKEISVYEKMQDDGNKKLTKVYREIEKLKKDKDKRNDKLKILEGEILDKSSKLGKLNEIVASSDVERLKKLKILQDLTNQRDVYGTLLVRRNDELSLLYQKSRIMKQALDNGEKETHIQDNDARMLKITINDLQRNMNEVLSINDIGKMKEKEKKIEELEKKIRLYERTSLGYCDYLTNPMYQHRYNIIKPVVKDVDLSKKLQKSQLIMLKLTEKLIGVETLIKKKKKVIKELNEIYKRQPGFNEFEIVNSLENRIKDKIRRMKALQSEMNCCNFLQTEKKYQIQRLDGMKREINNRYLKYKKRNERNRFNLDHQFMYKSI